MFELIDVRCLSEIATGRIPGGKAAPMRDLPGLFADWDRDAHYVIYCRSGIRSYQICGLMLENGFKNVENLSDGIYEWCELGLPLTNTLESEVGSGP